jgi:hypothetical protein
MSPTFAGWNLPSFHDQSHWQHHLGGRGGRKLSVFLALEPRRISSISREKIAFL